MKTWLIAAWRNFLKHKSFSIINISGLSLGIACLISILLYVLDEVSYDKFHDNAARIYQINVTISLRWILHAICYNVDAIGGRYSFGCA